MMIYANGKGAARNFDLALKFACEWNDSVDENNPRFEHLLKLKNENWTGNDFSLCDDQSGTTEILNWCAKQNSDEVQAVNTDEASAITKKWTAAEKTALLELQKAAAASFEASTQNEVDLSGTIRTVSMSMVQTSLNDDFVAALQSFDKGQAWAAFCSDGLRPRPLSVL